MNLEVGYVFDDWSRRHHALRDDEGADAEVHHDDL